MELTILRTHGYEAKMSKEVCEHFDRCYTYFGDKNIIHKSELFERVCVSIDSFSDEEIDEYIELREKTNITKNCLYFTMVCPHSSFGKLPIYLQYEYFANKFEYEWEEDKQDILKLGLTEDQFEELKIKLKDAFLNASK